MTAVCSPLVFFDPALPLRMCGFLFAGRKSGNDSGMWEFLWGEFVVHSV
ncbi:MAG: hypothetical protein ACD_75C00280G0001, partial [uncultured bacterium]